MENTTTLKTIKDVIAYWVERYGSKLVKGDILFVRDESGDYDEMSFEYDGMHFYGADTNSRLAQIQNVESLWVLD